jgi:DNA polymerase-3 subunit beta
MKIETTAEALANALRSHVADKESTIPVLSYARIQSNKVITSNLNLHCIAEFEAKVTGEPDFLIPCHQVLKLLDEQTGPLTLEFQVPGDPNNPKEQQASGIKLIFGGCVFTFNAMNVANFPKMSDTPLLMLEFDGAEFKKMIDRVYFSISREESRYTLSGALLRIKDSKVHMIATDGHRLSLVESPAENAPPTKDTMLSRSALKWIKGNIGDEISLGFGDHFHVAKTGNATLIFRSLSGQFPKFEAVIPDPEKVTVTAKFPSSRRLREVLSQVAMCADEASGAVKWHFGEELQLAAKSMEDGGSAKAVLDCKTDGEMEIGWNAGYILDLLGIVEDAPLVISLQDAQSAALFELDGMKYIVMPMRI